MSPHDQASELERIELHRVRAERAIRAQTSDAPYLSSELVQSLTGWSDAMCRGLALRRLSASDPEDTMLSIGITEILHDGDLCELGDRGQLRKLDRPAPALDVFAELARTQARVTSAPGRVYQVTVASGHAASAVGGNIFATANRPATIGVDEAALAIPDTLRTADELAFYGFALVEAGTVFRIRTPIDIVPIIPLYVGTSYARNIRDGFYIECHGGVGPVHFWAPTQPECLGYITAAKQVDAEHFLFARIEIPVGKMLVCHADAWHCDGTLSGGVYTTTFGFQKGQNADRDHSVTTLQPLLDRSGRQIAPPPDRAR